MKTIVLSHAAARDLEKLPASARRQIAEGLVAFALGRPSDVKPLKGRPESRLRIGDYRVLFRQSETEIVVSAIADRKDIY
jgi:mRNA interferase RelE/StbE